MRTTKKKQEEPDEQEVVGVHFNDGCVRHEGHIYIAGKLKDVDTEEVTFSRTYMYSVYDDRTKGPRFGHNDYPGWNVISVCHFSSAPFSAAAGWNGARVVTLSARGDVAFGTRGAADVKERIPKVLGSVTQVREIGDTLYVCGMQGQVFQRHGKTWRHIDEGIFDPEVSETALHLTSIDGTSESDIYAVGFGGRVLHYDGRGWDELVSPTNVHLERVHCVSRSEVYICGNRGTFFKLSNGVFSDFSLRTEDHFWGMTSFQEKIYLSNLKGIHVFDGKKVRPVDTKLKPAIDGYRLDACKEQLWSFGVDDLAWFDGKKWTRLKHPDNS